LQNAWNKYGESAFTFGVVATSDNPPELNALEVSFIASAPDGYNLKSGGYHDHHSPETRRKIGEKARGHKRWLGKKHRPESIAKMRQKTMSPEARQKISNAASRRGPVSAETREKIGKASRGRRLSAETRRKMSEAQRGNQKSLGHRHTPEARKKMSEARRAALARKTEAERRMSPEARRIRSDSGRAAWARRKEGM
jgi:hypothetical protein